MKKWRTVQDLMDWAKYEQNLAIKWCVENFETETLKGDLTICSKVYRSELITRIDLSGINFLNDELVLALWDIFDVNKGEIDLLNIIRFADTYERIQYFNKSKLSKDGTKYKQELLRLKQNADELQRLSDTEIKFRIPFLPHETIKDYIDLELRYCLDEGALRSLVYLIDDRLKFPKKTELSKMKEKEFHTNQINSLKAVSDKYKYIDKEQGFLKPYNTDEEIKEYEHEHQKALQEARQNYFYYTAKK